jgi:hypothetical protein
MGTERTEQSPNANRKAGKLNTYDETNDFINLMNREVTKYVYWELKSRFEKPDHELMNLINEFQISKDYEKFINYLDANCPNLIYYYSRGYTNSIKVFFHLLANYFTSDIDRLFQDGTYAQIDFFSILNEINADDIQKYNEIKDLVLKHRPSPGKIPQNMRDIDAIYSIIKLNEVYNKNKRMFIFISSAPFLVKMAKRYENNFLKGIEGKKIKVLRDHTFFLTAMIGIGNYLNYKKNKIDFNNLDLKELSDSIENDISKLDNYLSYLNSAGGVLKEIIEQDLAQELDRQNKIINEFDFTILIDEYVKIEHAELYNINQRETAEAIIKTFEDGKFINKLYVFSPLLVFRKFPSEIN